MKYLKCLLMSLVFVGSNVSAGIPVPELLSTEPSQPRANQQFDLVYTLEFCGDVFAPDFPQNRIIEVSGSHIRVTARYHLNICFEFQEYTPEYRWRIEGIPAGTYQLELRAYYEESGPGASFPIASGEVTIEPVPMAPEPNVVPAAGKLSVLSLSLLTAMLAMWGLRRR